MLTICSQYGLCWSLGDQMLSTVIYFGDLVLNYAGRGPRCNLDGLWDSYYDLTEQSGNSEVPCPSLSRPPRPWLPGAGCYRSGSHALGYDTTLKQPSNGSLTPHLLASGRWFLQASEKVLELF